MPPAYSGTFSARLTNSGVPGYFVEFTGGTVRFAKEAETPGVYYGYTAESGSATVTVHAPGGNGCELDGSGPVSFAPGAYGPAGQLNIYEGSPQEYDVVLSADPTASIEVTTSGCSDPKDNGKTESYMVGNQRGLQVPRPGTARPAVQPAGSITGTTTYSEDILTHTFTWALNPSE
jgi:hypothetical protein